MNSIQTVFAFYEVDQAVVDAVRKIARPSKRKTIAPPATLFSQLNLELPLFDTDDLLVRGVAIEVVPAAKDPERILSFGAFDDMPIELVALWHAKVLYRDLELLLWKRDADGTARREILNWIFATDFGWTTDDINPWPEPEEGSGKRRPPASTFVGPPVPELTWVVDLSLQGKDKTYERLRRVPFSFELCCRVEEIDPEHLRSSITERLQQLAQPGTHHRVRAALH